MSYRVHPDDLPGLQVRHRALDEEIQKMERVPSACHCRIREMKRQKLDLKDRIAFLERHTGAVAAQAA